MTENAETASALEGVDQGFPSSERLAHGDRWNYVKRRNGLVFCEGRVCLNGCIDPVLLSEIEADRSLLGDVNSHASTTPELCSWDAFSSGSAVENKIVTDVREGKALLPEVDGLQYPIGGNVQLWVVIGEPTTAPTCWLMRQEAGANFGAPALNEVLLFVLVFLWIISQRLLDRTVRV